jgi:hypothetical protein
MSGPSGVTTSGSNSGPTAAVPRFADDHRGESRGTDDPGGPVNTRTIAILALVIAVIVLVLLLR